MLITLSSSFLHCWHHSAIFEPFATIFLKRDNFLIDKFKFFGISLDKNGNIVPNNAPEAHIPIEEFIYMGN
jgi:hypothetical protein